MTNGDVVWATENFGKVREREAYKVRATVRVREWKEEILSQKEIEEDLKTGRLASDDSAVLGYEERVTQVSLEGLSGWWPASIFEPMADDVLAQLREKAAEALGYGLPVSPVILRAIGPVEPAVVERKGMIVTGNGPSEQLAQQIVDFAESKLVS